MNSIIILATHCKPRHNIQSSALDHPFCFLRVTGNKGRRGLFTTPIPYFAYAKMWSGTIQLDRPAETIPRIHRSAVTVKTTLTCPQRATRRHCQKEDIPFVPYILSHQLVLSILRAFCIQCHTQFTLAQPIHHWASIQLLLQNDQN